MQPDTSSLPLQQAGRGKQILWDALALLGGSAIFAAGYNMFLLPNSIVLGGTTGIATVCKILFDISPGFLSACVNLPLLFLSLILCGPKGFWRTLLGILAASVMVDALAFLPSLTEEKLMAAVFGGGVTAVGLGIALLRGFTSGGSDLAAYLLRAKFRRLSIGNLVLCIDGVIIVAAAAVLQDLSGLFYSIVTIVVYSIVIDAVVSHSRAARLALMICPEEMTAQLAQDIAAQMDRGLTRMDGSGWYTGRRRCVLLCAVKPREVQLLTDIVQTYGDEVFLIFLTAPQVFGRRFTELPHKGTPTV